jgi:drug/metabolite transporter (DMT)-like permease
MSDAIAPASPRPQARTGWFLNPYFQIFIGALCTTAGEMLFKKGANASHAGAGVAGLIGVTPLLSAWTWLGVIVYVISLVSWLHVLRFLPLSIAFPLINAVHVLVPVGSMIFLHEKVSLGRWAGIVITLCGILMLITPLVRAEEKL